MKTTPSEHVVRARRQSTISIGVCLAALMACTEPVSNPPAVAALKMAEARLILSDSAAVQGARVDVYAQVTAATPDVVGSYTARIRYDTTALRYEQEITIVDDALRATNVSSGLLRFAGAAPKGLPSGRLAGYRFLVLRPRATASLQLVIDEMHSVARTDAASMLRSMPNRIGSEP